MGRVSCVCVYVIWEVPGISGLASWCSWGIVIVMLCECAVACINKVCGRVEVVGVSAEEMLGIWVSCGMYCVGFLSGSMGCVCGCVAALVGGWRVGWVGRCAREPGRCSCVPSVAISWVFVSFFVFLMRL